MISTGHDYGHDWFHGAYDSSEGAVPVNHLRKFNKQYYDELCKSGQLEDAVKDRMIANQDVEGTRELVTLRTVASKPRCCLVS